MTTTVAERVRAGATLLDANVPGWYELINPDRLVMNDCIGCVLGQTFGNYVVGCNELGITAWAHSQAVDFGFHSAADLACEDLDRMPEEEQDRLLAADRDEYAALRTAWLAEIDQRLKPAPTIESRVQAGAAYLDSLLPDWFELVDPDRLDISSRSNDLNEYLPFELRLSRDERAAYGMLSESALIQWSVEWKSLPPEDRGRLRSKTMAEYQRLNDAWRDLILARREAKADSEAELEAMAPVDVAGIGGGL